MNKQRNPLIYLIAAFAALIMCVLPCQAQKTSITDVGITNSIAANATTTANLGSAIDLRKHRDCGLLLSFQGDAAGTDNITVTIVRSLDSSTWESTPGISWVTAANGTTAVNSYTNLTTSQLGAARYIKILSIANAAASANMTNCSLKVIRKSD